MKRTQLYIDPQSYNLALQAASFENTTISDIFRKAVRHYSKSQPKPKNSLIEIAKLAKTFKWPKNTPKDLSYNLDHYLYGTPKKPLPKKWTHS